jgi:hypothetical protein
MLKITLNRSKYTRAKAVPQSANVRFAGVLPKNCGSGDLFNDSVAKLQHAR